MKPLSLKNTKQEQLDQDRLMLDRVNADLERDKFEFDKKKQEFEILKTLHDSGLARWKDRRENEWKLNYAIWAAIAGLDALLLHDQSGILVPPGWLWLAGAACFALHSAYLWPTISRAIAEIKLQSDAEHAMRRLIVDKSLRDEINVDHLGGFIRRFQKLDGNGKLMREGVRSQLWKHYGLFAPLFFTIALLSLGGLLLTGHLKATAKSGDKGGVVQFFAAPPGH